MRILPVTPERWPDLERLFGPQGAYSGCWCTFYRMPRAAYSAAGNAGRKRVMRAAVAKGPPPGLLAYEEGEPVAWVAVAPREETPVLDRSPVSRSPDARPAWAITCYFVRRDRRGAGMMVKLTEAAARYAAKQGATLVEAWPVEKAARAGCSGYTGVASALAACGFEEIARPRANRVYMRRGVGGQRPREEKG